MPDYCPICHYPFDENDTCMCASSCPCGCNNDHRLICTYDHSHYCESDDFMPSFENPERCAVCGYIRRPIMALLPPAESDFLES